MSSSEEILHQRALRLARPLDQEAAGATIKVLEFTIGQERYAFPTSLIDEVYPLRDLAPLPGTEAFLLGITSVRGRIVSVMDLHVFFGFPSQVRADSHPIVVLRSAAMEFAVAADGVNGVHDLPQSSIKRPVAASSGVREEYLMGLTRDGVVVLDAAQMLADPRLVSNQLPQQREATGGRSA